MPCPRAALHPGAGASTDRGKREPRMEGVDPAPSKIDVGQARLRRRHRPIPSRKQVVIPWPLSLHPRRPSTPAEARRRSSSGSGGRCRDLGSGPERPEPRTWPSASRRGATGSTVVPSRQPEGRSGSGDLKNESGVRPKLGASPARRRASGPAARPISASLSGQPLRPTALAQIWSASLCRPRIQR
jgi:hypothetical protein